MSNLFRNWVWEEPDFTCPSHGGVTSPQHRVRVGVWRSANTPLQGTFSCCAGGQKCKACQPRAVTALRGEWTDTMATEFSFSHPCRPVLLLPSSRPSCLPMTLGSVHGPWWPILAGRERGLFSPIMQAVHVCWMSKDTEAGPVLAPQGMLFP